MLVLQTINHVRKTVTLGRRAYGWLFWLPQVIEGEIVDSVDSVWTLVRSDPLENPNIFHFIKQEQYSSLGFENRDHIAFFF
jgi:hypothetical protein